jgi:hypothetical protein
MKARAKPQGHNYKYSDKTSVSLGHDWRSNFGYAQNKMKIANCYYVQANNSNNTGLVHTRNSGAELHILINIHVKFWPELKHLLRCMWHNVELANGWTDKGNSKCLHTLCDWGIQTFAIDRLIIFTWFIQGNN